MEELWKDIPGYEGYYQASSLGRIKGPRRVLRPFITSRGYHLVCLSVRGETTKKSVHRLVASAFYPNPYNLPQVNHKDENPLNNQANNLEWCTCKYNNNYGSRNAKLSASIGFPVLQYTDDGEIIGRYVSANEAGRITGLWQPNISSVCRGVLQHCGGYRWKYLPKEEV